MDCERRSSLDLSTFVHHYTGGEEGGTDSRCVSTSFEFRMDDPEQWLLSDSEEEEGADFDPYQCDPQFENEKSRIRETLNLSTNAMKRNKKIIGDIHFFWTTFIKEEEKKEKK